MLGRGRARDPRRVVPLLRGHRRRHDARRAARRRRRSLRRCARRSPLSVSNGWSLQIATNSTRRDRSDRDAVVDGPDHDDVVTPPVPCRSANCWLAAALSTVVRRPGARDVSRPRRGRRAPCIGCRAGRRGVPRGRLGRRDRRHRRHVRRARGRSASTHRVQPDHRRHAARSRAAHGDPAEPRRRRSSPCSPASARRRAASTSTSSSTRRPALR